jgi:cysteinyl-tRNA synthetase
LSIKIYNSLARKEQEFEPVHEGRVHMYVCGPTVYADAHVGHGKTYVNFDTVRRYFMYKGYDVRYVENITDVGHLLDSGEDRIIMGAERDQVEPMELVEEFTRRFFEDMDTLNVLRPDIAPRATGHIPEQIELVKKLLDKGYAYEVDGNVYFDVEKFEEYGKLSGRRLEDMEAGSRVKVAEDKRNPADFALWKKAPPEHIMKWNSPWGWGYPGWHAECSAMATKYLGQPFDIHGGGMENKFPHHEDEIAQSEAAEGVTFAKYWMHNGMLMIRGEEMHKSLGNFVTLREAFERYHPMTLRLFILTAHYRSPLDLTADSIEAAERGRQRLWGAVRAVRARLEDAPEGELSDQVEEIVTQCKTTFEENMDDDFNTPGALGALYDFTREVNSLLNADETLSRGDLEAIDEVYRRMGGEALGIIPEDLEEEGLADLSDSLVEVLVEARTQLREAQEWELADKVRDRLLELGIELKDTPEGTTWRYTGS